MQTKPVSKMLSFLACYFKHRMLDKDQKVNGAPATARK
jgi:hypothetical protein